MGGAVKRVADPAVLALIASNKEAARQRRAAKRARIDAPGVLTGAPCSGLVSDLTPSRSETQVRDLGVRVLLFPCLRVVLVTGLGTMWRVCVVVVSCGRCLVLMRVCV